MILFGKRWARKSGKDDAALDLVSGFTLMEFLLFAAIFAMTMMVFTTILITILRIHARQSSAAEVNQQTQFLLQAFQRYIEESALIEMSFDVPDSILKLRMAAATNDPTYICLGVGVCELLSTTSTAVYVKETSAGTPQALTSGKVVVSSLQFTRRLNPAGHDSVNVSFTMEFNSQNPEQKFSRTIYTSIARTSPVVFNEDLLPTSQDIFVLGNAVNRWHSVNDTIYFNFASGTVGVRTPNPTQALEVNGGMRIRPETAAFVSCSIVTRGTWWVQDTGGGGQDNFFMCLKQGDEMYGWLQIYP